MKPKLADYLSGYRKIHVVGVSGQEGRAVFDYLLSYMPEAVIGHESGSNEEFPASFMRFSDAYSKNEAEAMLDRFLLPGVKINFAGKYLEGIEPGDLVVVTQAWRRYKQNAPLFNLPAGVELKQAIEIVFMVINDGVTTVGVTGTFGKSTTTSLIASAMKKRAKIYFSGNDRENKWDLFEAEKLEETLGGLNIALFEISHRHLMDMKVSPNVAVLMNIHPHHLDDAGSLDNYKEIKKNIFRFQKAGDALVVNSALTDSGDVKISECKGDVFTFGENKEKDFGYFDDKGIYVGGNLIISLDDLPLKGEHNYLSAAAASVVGYLIRSSWSAEPTAALIREGLMDFQPLKYRMEKVGEKDGLVFWNDGKSTDPIATIEAIKSAPDILILFLGGAREGGKPGDFSALGKEIAAKKIPKVFVYGRSRDLILNDLLSSGIDREVISFEENLKSAIPEAFKYMSGKTGSVIFSPACQSFDEFKDYRERAETFNRAVTDFLQVKRD